MTKIGWEIDKTEDPKVEEELNKREIDIHTEIQFVRAQTHAITESAKAGLEPLPESKQKEFSDKIVKTMSRILAKDTVRNFLNNFTFPNSLEFDKAAYEVEDGDLKYDTRRDPLYENPGNVDESLWAKAKDASMKAFGKLKYGFVTWFYKKYGGKFR